MEKLDYEKLASQIDKYANIKEVRALYLFSLGTDRERESKDAYHTAIRDYLGNRIPKEIEYFLRIDISALEQALSI